MKFLKARGVLRRVGAIALVLAASIAIPASALANVVRVVIDTREPIAQGASFGSAGAYERLTGRVYFELDPANPHDRQIVDLSRAPRNSKGKVEAWSEFVMLRPVDASRGSGVTLVDVVNRGGMTVGVFHLGANRELSPDSAAFYGDALLLRRGLTVVMLGWQWDILPGAAGLHFHPPVVGNAAHPITGLVRSDVTVDAPTHTISLGHVVGSNQALGYAVSDTLDPKNQLTVRDGPIAKRRVIPRKLWRFAREDSSGTAVDDTRSVYMREGFEAGKIYEVIYRASDPVVVGTGLAAVRDMISYLKYDSTSIAPTKVGIAYGVSQTGRFLRHFLYQNFNTDERGRRAFDGIFAHTAGAGRGSFNHRFAQPSRDAQPYNTFFYPTDIFPFTTVEENDPVTGRRDGLRVHHGSSAALPKVFYVDGGYEYWGRAASLTHTTVDGKRDVGFLPSERRYVISSVQHSSPARFPPADGSRFENGAAFRGDPLDQRLALRALLVAMVEWVKDGRAPPPSLYPVNANGSLVPVDSLRRPQIPGIALAKIPAQPYRYD
ncbi:MAG: alpha/beta hydrolase domain-containing protein, partial [Gemmatimonadota bacterium]